jgi:hypothetical protein
MNSGKFVRYDPGEEQQPQPAVMVPCRFNAKRFRSRPCRPTDEAACAVCGSSCEKAASQGHDARPDDKACSASSRMMPAHHKSGDCIQPLLTVDAR